MLLALPAIFSLQPAGATSLEKWLLMPGPVIASHADLEKDCKNCHAPLSDRPQGELCVACHTEVGDDITDDLGFHGRLPASEQFECSSCHIEHEGRETSIVELDEATFDHSLTNFILRGAHKGISCTDCHAVEETHRQAETACIACHRADDPHKGQLGETCDSCHNASSWTEALFDHGITRFSLTGAHILATCSACHRSEVFSDVGQTCNACHKSDDVHRGRNGTQCAECHSTSNWTNFTFNHLAITGFALDGGHRGLSCQDCHRAKDFLDLGGSDCNSCHRADDVHNGQNGSDCGSCHVVSDWGRVTFDHATRADFPLPAGHDKLACTACHIGSLKDELPRECGACHVNDDVHKGQLGWQCESCHIATNWTSRLWFDHDLTRFPLLGAHADVSCDSCHASAAFHDAQTYCVECHGDDDPHSGALGNQCDTCHNPADWRAWQFDHSEQTDFPLTGAHAGVACNVCHTSAVKNSAALPANCNSCHRRDDPHLGRFGKSCGSCHTTSSFSQVEGE